MSRIYEGLGGGFYPQQPPSSFAPNFPRGKDFFLSVHSLRSFSRNDRLYINPSIPINREEQLPLIKGGNFLFFPLVARSPLFPVPPAP